MISAKLEKQTWFLGEQISEIDFTIYAYLAILQHIGVSNNPLRTHMNECPSLLNYTKQVRTKYLKDISTVVDSSGAIVDRIKQLFVNKDDGEVSSTIIRLCFGFVAIGTMALYAVTHGLLEVS